jgi:hypothetical protein
MRDLEDEKRIKEYMAAKMTHIKMYNECMNLADGLDVAKFAELVRADEREACAKVIAPPKKEWVGLTDEEVSDILDREIGFNSCWGPETDFARAIEARLKEKNHANNT